MKTKLIFICAGVGLLLLIGCADDDSVEFGGHLQVSDVVATDSKLVFLNYNQNEAVLIDATDGAQSVQRINLPVGPMYAEKRKGNEDEVLILGYGSEGSRDSSEQPATLTRLNSQGQLVSYNLGFNPFDTLVQDPEGRFVFLLRRGNNDALIRNLNEIAVVDLAAPATSVNAVVIQTLESQPYSFFFSEQFKIGGTVRKLVCIASVNALSLVDLEHLDRMPTTVYLGQEEDANILPRQVIFDSATSRIYVRSENSDDLFTLRLSARDADVGHNNFATSMDIVAVGSEPSEMEMYSENGNSYLAVISARSHEAYFVDTATSKTWSVGVPAGISRIKVFQRSHVDNITLHALLWAPGNQNFYIMDFLNLEEMQGQNIRKIGQSQMPADELMSAFSGNRMLLLHQGSGLSIIDMDKETIEPFSSQVRLTDAAFDRTRNQFWVGPSRQLRIAYVNIENGKTDELLMDEPIEDIVPIFEAGKLAVIHMSALGAVTMVDVDDPSRNTAFMVKGFWMENSL